MTCLRVDVGFTARGATTGAYHTCDSIRFGTLFPENNVMSYVADRTRASSVLVKMGRLVSVLRPSLALLYLIRKTF